MSDILMLGYYGYKNSGDDALLLSIIQQLKNEDRNIKIKVLSNNPQETERIYNVRATDRNNIFSLIKEIKSAKMLLVGGGTLIQDSTSTKSLIYYLVVILIALLFNKKVMLYANGIGPVSDKNKKLTKIILNRVNTITLREEMSSEELKRIGVTKPEIILTADSVFGMEYSITPIQELENKNYLIVSVRNSKLLEESFCSDIASVLDELYEKYKIMTVFVPFQKNNDTKITEEIIKNMSSPSQIFDSESDISKLMWLFENAKACIGMRLHSLIYSVISKTPCVGLVYDPKVRAFMEYIGQKNYLDAHKLKREDLLLMVRKVFQNADEIKKYLEEKSKLLNQKSQENAKIAIQLLKN